MAKAKNSFKKIREEAKEEVEFPEKGLSAMEIEDYIRAGKISQNVEAFARTIIKKNALALEIAEKIENKILELGGKPAFPVNISIDEITAHYTPSSSDKTILNGLVKIDFGVEFNGKIADRAFSIDMTENNEHKKMIELNEKALAKALGILRPGVFLKEIGEAIHSEIDGTNYSVIRNLSGHALAENVVHAGLTIPNYRNNSTIKLNNIAIAIEPFFTQGLGEVYESSPSEIFMFQNEIPVRDNDTRKLVSFIKGNYKTKPFCKRWLEPNFKKLDFTLKLLTKQGILHNYPVLIEKSKRPVSQAEHTALILKDKVIVTTRD